MRLSPFLLTSSLLHGVGLVYGRWEAELDGNLVDEAIPRPTPEPLLYQANGPTLMETRLGYPRNGTARRDLALGSRQVWVSPGAGE